MREDRKTLCWYALRVCAGVLIYCVWAVLLVLLLGGCRHIPTQQGGATGVAIDGRGVSVSTRLADSPREASEQTVTRTVRETFAAPPSASALPSPAPVHAPTGLTTHTSPTAPVLSRETQETVHTRVGASQDLAGILKAAQSKWRAIVAIAFGIALLFGAWHLRTDWPTPAALLAAGAAASILTVNPWWGVAAIGAGALVALAWRAAKPV